MGLPASWCKVASPGGRSCLVQSQVVASRHVASLPASWMLTLHRATPACMDPVGQGSGTNVWLKQRINHKPRHGRRMRIKTVMGCHIIYRSHDFVWKLWLSFQRKWSGFPISGYPLSKSPIGSKLHAGLVDYLQKHQTKRGNTWMLCCLWSFIIE